MNGTYWDRIRNANGCTCLDTNSCCRDSSLDHGEDEGSGIPVTDPITLQIKQMGRTASAGFRLNKGHGSCDCRRILKQGRAWLAIRTDIASKARQYTHGCHSPTTGEQVTKHLHVAD